MRGLDDRLARIARRDELRQRTRPDTPRVDGGTDPGVSPVVDEVADALRAVVERNPGVFATVVVQEAETAWSVWIGEWDGTLRTRVTRLDPDPPAPSLAAVAEPDTPALTAVNEPDPGDEPTRPLAPPLSLVPPAASVPAAAPVPAAPATSVPPAAPVPARTPLSVVPDAGPASAPGPVATPADDVTALPRRRRRAVPAVSRALPAGPSRRPGEVSVTELLRPRRPLDDEISASAPTPPMGFRPLAATTGEAAVARPNRSAPLDPAAPLPKRIPDSGIPLPQRRPGLLSDVATADDPDPLPTRVPGRLALAKSSGVGPLVPPEVPLVAAGPRSLPAGPATPPDVPLPAVAPATLPAPEDTIWPPHAPTRHRPTPEADHRSADHRSADHRHVDQQPAELLEHTALPAPTIAAPPLAAAQRVSGPAMNDKVAGRIADMLRREAKRDNRGMTS